MNSGVSEVQTHLQRRQNKQNILTVPFKDFFSLILAHFSRVFKRLQHETTRYSADYDQFKLA